MFLRQLCMHLQYYTRSQPRGPQVEKKVSFAMKNVGPYQLLCSVHKVQIMQITCAPKVPYSINQTNAMCGKIVPMLN
jgi:hypothetical protein